MSNANCPMDASGATYHLGLKSGEVANRIVTCGDVARLRRFAQLLDPKPTPFELVSARGFTTVTGRYHDVPVSIIAIGMGEDRDCSSSERTLNARFRHLLDRLHGARDKSSDSR